MDYKELNLYVYNTSFQLIGIIDQYSSLIWSDRYDDCGDFELTFTYNSLYKDLLQQGNYVTTDYTDRFAIIEKIEAKKDEDAAPEMIVSGRSIECILEWRIVPYKVEFGDDETEVSLQNSIQTLVNDNIINPSDNVRQIPGFVFLYSEDPEITGLTFSESYNGNDLLGIIQGLCSDKHIGFKLIPNLQGQMIFSLYAGKNRTASTDSEGYVLFSPYLDNLKTSEYFSTTEDYRNVMLISKDEDEYIEASTESERPSGINRREIHEDASSLKENKESELSDDQLRVKAKKKLNEEHKIKTGFEGDIVPELTYRYRTDYNVGDKVQFEDIYGNSKNVWISEVVISFDENGLSILPTFEEIDWE